MKKNRLKRIVCGLMCVLAAAGVLGMTTLASAEMPTQTSEYFVNDFAGILSQSTKQYVINQGKALEQASKAQIVVSTIPSLNGDSIESYANNMFRTYKIGDKEKNNGVLILLALEEREVRIEVGYGLEGAINDAKAGRIIREVGKPFLQKDDFDSGLRSMYTAVLEDVYREYGLEVPKGIDSVKYVKDEGNGNRSYMIFFFILVAIIILNGNNRGGRSGRRRRYYGGFGGGGFGGGGFGGGSFGGGGSSGGGGASGKF